MIEVYTDGSCLKNPDGPGGWGFVVVYPDTYVIVDSGGDPSTTNNKMELTAIIEALKYIDKDKNDYTIFSDSMYCINCATGKWKRNKNLDLWKKYDTEIKGKNIKFEWVKAHNGNKYNEMVDKIAFGEAKKIQNK